MPRFYISSSGYIVDLLTDTHVARLKDREGWRVRGDRMCQALELCPEDATALIELWGDDLEVNNLELAST